MHKSIACFIALTGLVACSSNTPIDDATEGALGATDGGGVAVTPPTALPPPGSVGNRLDVDAVVQAWAEVRTKFYDSTTGYTDFIRDNRPGGAPTPAPAPKADPVQCFSACPAFWSDVACHYYCWMPAYARVTPNVRGCFSYATSPNVQLNRTDVTPPRKPFYPEAYDYCVYQEYDNVTNSTPTPYTQASIDALKQGGKKVGVLGWVDNDQKQRDVFKKVMFTWYEPRTYTIEDQQEAINKFYGVALTNKAYRATDAADVAACNAARPRRPNSDPTDGTHCSTTKDTSKLVTHPDAAKYIQYMTDYNARGGTTL